MPANWRLLEAEIIRIARKQGFDVTELQDGNQGITFEWEDGYSESVDLTDFAKELSERVEVKGGK